MKVLIHENALKWLKHHRQLISLEKIIQQIKIFAQNKDRISNNNTRQLFAGERIYKTRIGLAIRLVFALDGQFPAGKIKILSIGDHDRGNQAYRQKAELQNLNQTQQAFAELAVFNINESIVEETNPSSPVEEIFYSWDEEDASRLAIDPVADLQWNTDSEQYSIIAEHGPIILRGSAGSGKTTIALYRLINWRNNSPDSNHLYITYSHRLKQNTENQFGRLTPRNSTSEFKTIEELCIALLGPQQSCHFFNDEGKKNERFVNFAAFEGFARRHAEFNKKQFSLFLLWEEFRAILKGCFYLCSHLEQNYLNLQQYLNLTSLDMANDDSLFTKPTDRKHVYQLFEHYQKWLHIEGRWDELDLARATYIQLKNELQPKRYAQLIIDEIQDLTTYHLQIILHLSANPAGLFLTGDAHQSIHPSRFRWERLKSQLQHWLDIRKKQNHTQAHLYSKKVELSRLSQNYRSSPSIIALTNQIALWRSQVFKDEDEPVKAVKKANHPIAVLNDSHQLSMQFQAVENLSVSVMILVPNQEVYDELATTADGFLHNCKHCVSTIHDSKGLEAEAVILYKFFSYHPNFDQKQPYGHQFRYFTNLFNVACTRARQNLIIIDDKLPNWQPLSILNECNTDNAFKLLTETLAQTSTQEEFIEQALELESHEQWQRAADNWLKANQSLDYHRCLALLECERRNWQTAAEHFKQGRYFLKAGECYEKCQQLTEALIMYLQIPEMPKAIERLTYIFNDRTALQSLNQAGIKILNAILESSGQLCPSTLFEYSAQKNRFFAQQLSLLKPIQTALVVDQHHLILDFINNNLTSTMENV